MADLGVIGSSVVQPKNLHTHRLLGTVSDAEGTPLRHLVRAYDRVTGLLSGAAYSNSGLFTINVDIQAGNKALTVIDLDNTYENNARVFDRVIPVPL